MANKILVIAFIFFCFELGMLLVVFPWSPYWENNLILTYIPSIEHFILSNYFRGAVSGLGIVDISIGLWETVHFKIAVAHLEKK